MKVDVNYEAVLNAFESEIDSLRSDEIRALTQEINQLVVPLVEKMALPKNIELRPEVPLLGNFLSRKVSRIYEKLLEKHKERLPLLAGLANKYYRTAMCGGALWFKLSLERKQIADNEFTRMRSTEDGYTKVEGGAYMFYNHLADLSLQETLDATYGHKHVADDMLEAIGIYWLNQVNDEMRDRGTIDFELLGEALEAMEIANGNSMWDGARECAREDISNQRSRAAQKRHKENYEMKEQVSKYYRENKDQFKSHDAAAEAILKANLVPVSYRTIRGWITEFNKPQSAC